MSATGPKPDEKAAALLPVRMLRWVATGCAGLIWLLGLLAISPQLHAALHDDAGAADHSCAITLFSHGTEPALPDLIAVTAPPHQVECILVPAGPLLVESPEDWLQPGRGPPVR